MRHSYSHSLIGIAAVLTALSAHAGFAQPLTHRTPNVEGAWVTSPWNLYFAFNHRFRVLGEDKNIVDLADDGVLDNSPTFNLALGTWAPGMVGIKYSSQPAIRREGSSNEWFPYAKIAPWRTDRWGLSILAGYNTQAQSVDGELSGQVTAGRLELLGAARGFSDALHTGDAGLALAGGLGIRLTNFIVLAGDVGGFVAGLDTTVAWSAGLQLAIPFTPHTLSLQVSNASGTTPQEASFGGFGDDVAWGFEFTVPFSGFARWGRIFDQEDDSGRSAGAGAGAGAGAADPAREPRRVVEIDIRQFRFQSDTLFIDAGTVVRWVNRDAIAHTSTSDADNWRSPLIGPGETYTRRFEEAGTYAYHCEPHPFMRAVIIVKPREG